MPSQDVEFDEDDLLAWAADRLQRLDVLREIRLVDVIPRNPAGKVLRHRLRAVASDADDT